MIARIRNINDVKLFFAQLIEEGTTIHPDDDFRNIVSLSTGELTYTKSEADTRNVLMGQAFQICENHKRDIYDLGLTITLRKSGLGKFIPVPATRLR